MSFVAGLPSKPLAIVSLILSNLVLLFGVWYWGWNSSTIILLYWFESAIIGYFNVQKMRKVVANSVEENNPNMLVMGMPFLIGFFMLHYSGFMFVHLIFLLIFFLRPDLNWWGLLVGVLSLIFSHFISYQQNFINGQEYLHKSAAQYFISPYARIIGMHIAVIGGAFLMMQQGHSVVTLSILVVVKTVIDLVAHLVEHKSAKQNNKMNMQ